MNPASHPIPGRIVLGTGSLAALLGLVVMAGWWLRVPALVQVLPGLALMQFNTALGFVLCGGGLAALAAGRERSGLACGVAVGALALLTLAEYAWDVALGLDTLFVRPFLGDAFSPTGRMSPATATAFTLSGAALATAAGALPRRHAAALVGTLGTMVLALACFALIGYASGLIGAGGYSRVQGMAAHTAAGFLAVGAGLFALAWGRGTAGGMALPAWLAVPVAIGGATLTVALFLALVAQERTDAGEQLQRGLAALATRIEEQAGAQMLALVRMARRWEARGGTPREEWERDAALYRLHHPGLHLLAWVDAAGRIRWAVPQEEAHPMLEQPLAGEDGESRQVLAQVRQRTGITVTRAFRRLVPEPSFQAVLPVHARGRFDGFLLAVFDVRQLLAPILGQNEQRGGRYAVSEAGDAGEALYRSPGGAGDFRGEPVGTARIRMRDGMTWRLQVWVTEELVAAVRSPLPGATLAVGLVLSALLALSTHLGLHALGSRVRVEAANRRLEGEIAERGRAEARFRRVVESTPNAMVIVDGDGRITLVNAQTLRWFGYRSEELLGRPVEILVPERFRAEHPEHRRRYVAAPTTRPMGTGRELYGRRKDGSEFPVDISLSPLETPEGLRVISAISDITERRRAEEELQRSNTALEAVNKELEAFAYAVSHDLRQPLRGMTGFGEILLEDYADKLDEQGRDYIRRIRAAARRMGRLIDDLLALSRVTRGELGRERVDLSALADAVLAELRQGHPGREVEARIQPGLEADGDPRLLRVMLENLLSNAWKFTGRTAQARIELGCTEDGAGRTYFVRDNGAGFDMAHADKLFGAFQRLHGVEEFPGTGVGLATVQRIVRRHGGRIWAEAEKGRGATFRFTLG